MYVQDYGAPVGWRLALRDPQAVTAIITQNGNGYDAGFVPEGWTAVWDYQREQTPETAAALRQFLSFEATRNQYVAACPIRASSARTPGTYDLRAVVAPRQTTRSNWRCSRTTRATRACIPRCTSTCAPVGVPVLAVWGDKDPSSGRTVPGPSPRTLSTPRSTCATAATS